MKKLITIITTICISIISIAQIDINDGYNLLNEGSFLEAKTFFKDYLEIDSKNFSAQICYGRALGLSGETDNAIQYFENLKERHPDNLEVAINYAETFMWSNDFLKAKQLYADLEEENPCNFTIVLSYANALANLKLNESALTQINNAIYIEDNLQAQTSKKYILLALQVDKRDLKLFEEAHLLLDEIEAIFPNDKDVLLNKAVLYLIQENYKKAANTYNTILHQDASNIDALLGISYAYMVLKRSQKSIYYAKLAQEVVNQSNYNDATKTRSLVNLINALGAAQNFKSAHELTDSLLNNLSAPIATQTKSRLYFWAQNMKQAVNYAEQSIELQPNSYEAKLGSAEIFIGQKNYSKAIELLKEAKQIDSSRDETNQIIEKIKKLSRGNFSFTSEAIRDNGGDQSIATNVRVNFQELKNIRPYITAGHKAANRKEEGFSNGLHTYQGSIGINWQPNNQFSLFFDGGATMLPNNENTQVSFLANAGLKYKTNKAHNLGLIFSNEMYNYNESLIEDAINTTNLTFNYQKLFNSGAGIYGALGTTYYSDKNAKIWGFTSLYKEFNSFVKIGVNYNQTHFTNPDKASYFSPTIFKAAEGFIGFELKNYNIRKWSFKAMFASGIQQINQDKLQYSYRWEAGIGSKLSDNVILETFVRGSNTANASARGYSFYSFGVNLNYNFKRAIIKKWH